MLLSIYQHLLVTYGCFYSQGLFQGSRNNSKHLALKVVPCLLKQIKGRNCLTESPSTTSGLTLLLLEDKKDRAISTQYNTNAAMFANRPEIKLSALYKILPDLGCVLFFLE